MKQARKYISITLRLVLAVLGIGYIVWTLTWHDQVLIPAGYQFVDGQVAEQDMTLRVISDDPDGKLTIEGPGEGELIRLAVPRDTVSADQPRFKPGIGSMLREARWGLLLFGVVLMLPVFPIQGLRWWLLMRCRGIDVPFGRAMRLTMVGLFFNFCMPGMTGGDVVKAYYAAKGSGKRGVAVMSVVFDRAAGLMGLILLAGFAGLILMMTGDLDADVRSLVWKVTVLIWAGFFAVLLSAYLFFSMKVRRLVGFQKLIDRMGPDKIIVRIDDAAGAYRDHRRVILATVLLSLPVHLCQALATTCAGWALGMGLSAGLMLTVLPVVFLAGSVPLTYQGLGVMEALAVAMLLPSPTADANQLVSMLVMIRLFLILYALVGAVFMLRGDIHLHVQAEENVEAEESGQTANTGA